MRPAITIGVACYNAEKTVEAAIRSAIDQDIGHIEIIVVDDASTDRSGDILRRLARSDDRIRLIECRRNCGAAAAYNSVIDAATSEHVMFLDADDRALPARARLTTEALRDFRRPAISFCDRHIAFEGGRLIRGLTRPLATPRDFEMYMLDAICLHHSPEFYRGNSNKFTNLRSHGLGGSSAGTGVMTAATALLRSLRFDEELRRFCDTELNLRAAKQGVAAIGVMRPLAVQTETRSFEKSLAWRRKFTSRILTKHEAAFRRHGVAYPGHHHSRPLLASPPKVSMTPRATVGLLTFNCEDTLPRAIESARAQTEADVEIVIIDDASTDLTLEIARSYGDRRIRVLESPWNLGAGANRARLVAAARGEYLAFFDDDDASLPRRVETQINDLEMLGPHTISIASAFRHLGGVLREAHQSLGNQSGILEAKEACRLVWRTILQHSEGKDLLKDPDAPRARYALGASLMCGRTQLFREDPFDPGMRRMQDLEFLARFTAKGGRLVPTATPLIDVFVTRSTEKRWSKVVESCTGLLARHDGELERVLGVSTSEVLERNRTNLPSIRVWEGMRAAFGY